VNKVKSKDQKKVN